jgi:hypothetical protein
MRADHARTGPTNLLQPFFDAKRRLAQSLEFHGHGDP